MASFRTTRPAPGYYRMLNSISSADLYTSETATNRYTWRSHLQLCDSSPLPEDVYIVDRLISSRKLKVRSCLFLYKMNYTRVII